MPLLIVRSIHSVTVSAVTASTSCAGRDSPAGVGRTPTTTPTATAAAKPIQVLMSAAYAPCASGAVVASYS